MGGQQAYNYYYIILLFYIQVNATIPWGKAIFWAIVNINKYKWKYMWKVKVSDEYKNDHSSNIYALFYCGREYYALWSDSDENEGPLLLLLAIVMSMVIY